MQSQRADPPAFLIVAGPNGSGKSSAYQDADVEFGGRSVWIINPDLLAARIRDVEGIELGAANLEAVIRIEAWLEASIRAHQTVGVETVLSTDKYRRLVHRAKSLGFELWLLYVLLDSPPRNVERVRLRVKKGATPYPRTRSWSATHGRSRNCRGSLSRPTGRGSTITQERSRVASETIRMASSRWTGTRCRRSSRLRARSRRTNSTQAPRRSEGSRR